MDLFNNKVAFWGSEFYYYFFLEKRENLQDAKVSHNTLSLIIVPFTVRLNTGPGSASVSKNMDSMNALRPIKDTEINHSVKENSTSGAGPGCSKSKPRRRGNQHCPAVEEAQEYPRCHTRGHRNTPTATHGAHSPARAALSSSIRQTTATTENGHVPLMDFCRAHQVPNF